MVLVWARLILVLGLVIMVHELGHAWALYRLGIPLERLGIGAPVPFLTLRFRNIERFRIEQLTISPILFWGWVKPTEKGSLALAEMDYSARASVYGGGIWANMLATAILFALSLVTTELPGFNGVGARAAFALLIFALLKFRRQFSTYVVPALAVVTLILLASSLVSSPKDAFHGPIGIARDSAAEPVTPSSFYWQLLNLQFAIGITQALPIGGLDGGKYLSMWAENWKSAGLRKAVNTGGMALLVLLILGSCVGDLIR